MSPRSDRRRGFSLAEAMVSLTLLVVVMVVALTLLFTMRSFAERVQWVIEPRQTARRAVDYLAHFLQGATDAGTMAPNAIVTYYNSDATNAASLVQATYDNLTAAQAANGLGDEGTDVISVILPTGTPSKFLVSYPAPTTTWPGFSPPTQDFYISFTEGCGATFDDNANMTAFKQLTRENGTGHSNALLLLQDNVGAWTYFRISAYVAADANCDCKHTNGANIHIQADPGDVPAKGTIDPPGGHAAGMADPVALVTGLEAFSFRVRTVGGVPSLEQKTGLFDPATDNPGTAFVPIIENVEDLQIAYLYTDGTFWQSSANSLKTLDATAYPDDVPSQAGPAGVPPARDITQVMGLRFSVVARSRPVTFGARQISGAKTGTAVGAVDRRFRPAVENRAGAATYDDFEHFRATVTLMLKNRMLGS
ncbi:MAG TPA: prepilin-type N-terminal cleavage/methylation domain-containing protein [Thermoanaerobaculia bacterium]|nr:prepilin-type N-terminal cleavage/methylation domain-containing protein [Thermoanaerobaculia bacterium]HQR66962.1 prepilin-type N-terminal cleavage/methylation domain-containing protein [Thermoanaerobaculia bacterium]